MSDVSTAALSRAVGAMTRARAALSGGTTTPCCEQWKAFNHAADFLGELSWWAEMVQAANQHARKNLPVDVARFAKAQDQAIEKAREHLREAAGHLRAAHSHVGALCGLRDDLDLPHND
jgi:hypothetical protein